MNIYIDTEYYLIIKKIYRIRKKGKKNEQYAKMKGPLNYNNLLLQSN
jgi:hypothetical protein